GWTLLHQGEFTEALQVNHQLLKLLPAKHPGRTEAQWQLRQCETLLGVERQLQVYLDKGEAPGSVPELLALIQRCRTYKQYHATAARLYAAVFVAQPALAEPPEQHRYQAARSALLAAAGQGRDPVPPTALEQTNLRSQALAWLRADLQHWTRRFQDRDSKA